jgi:hypothetical protein
MRQLVLALVLAAVACGDAAAQYGRRGAPGGAGNQSMPRDEVTMMSANDQARLQLSSARMALKLTPEQAPAWQVYENKVVDLLDDLARGSSTPEGNALKQINARIDVVRNRLTALEDISDAAVKLYGVLTEEQKSTADRTLAGTLPTLYSGAPLRPDPSRRR